MCSSWRSPALPCTHASSRRRAASRTTCSCTATRVGAGSRQRISVWMAGRAAQAGEQAGLAAWGAALRDARTSSNNALPFWPCVSGRRRRLRAGGACGRGCQGQGGPGAAAAEVGGAVCRKCGWEGPDMPCVIQCARHREGSLKELACSARVTSFLGPMQVPHAPEDLHRGRVVRLLRLGALWRRGAAGAQRCAAGEASRHLSCAGEAARLRVPCSLFCLQEERRLEGVLLLPAHRRLQRAGRGTRACRSWACAPSCPAPPPPLAAPGALQRSTGGSTGAGGCCRACPRAAARFLRVR